MPTLEDLLADPRNPRAITGDAANGLRASVGTFGDISGLTWNQHSGTMVAGHQRLNALKAEATRRGVQLYMDDGAIVLPAGAKPQEVEQRFPVRVVDWTDQQQAAANMTANNPAIGGMFTEGLGAMLAEVEAALPKLFADTRLAELRGEAERLSKEARQAAAGDEDPPEPREDEAAALAVKWGTALGQVWEVPSAATPGQSHRLRCGDSTDPACVDALLGGLTIRMLETDPPYGIDYSALKNGIPGSGFADHTAQHGHIENDGLTDGPALQAFLERMIRLALPYMAEDAAYYFWHPMLTQGTFFAAAAAAAAADILIHRQIIWVKRGFVLTRSGMYHWRHELCFYGWVRGFMPPWFGDKSQTSVWDDFGRDDDHGMHPTQKPIELFLRPMRNHVLPGQWVYEPFLGSGSQVLAAERHGCLCAGMEISPKFLAVTLQRLSDMGLEPRLVP